MGTDNDKDDSCRLCAYADKRGTEDITVLVSTDDYMLVREGDAPSPVLGFSTFHVSGALDHIDTTLAVLRMTTLHALDHFSVFRLSYVVSATDDTHDHFAVEVTAA